MKKPSKLFILFISAIIFGLLAAVSGAIIVKLYLIDNGSLANTDVNLADSAYSHSNLIIRDAKKVVVNQDVKVTETLASLQPLLVAAVKTDAKDKPAYYDLRQADAFGLAITADGWVFFGGTNGKGVPSDLIKNYQAITYDKKVYKFDKILTVKTAAGPVFFAHLKGASNLAVRPVATAVSLQPGTSLLVVAKDGAVMPTFLTGKVSPKAEYNSDHPQIGLVLANSLSSEFKNALVFDIAGDFVGWVDGNLQAQANYAFMPAWNSLLINGQAAFPELGLNYFNLSSIKALNVKSDNGAWLHKTATEPAVIVGSPADLAGLKENDVIIRVDNQGLDSNTDLGDLLTGYLPGDTITVGYLRNGVPQETDIKLGVFK
jgi:hypothetical protein